MRLTVTETKYRHRMPRPYGRQCQSIRAVSQNSTALAKCHGFGHSRNIIRITPANKNATRKWRFYLLVKKNHG
jgi:hypothetical protein